MGWTETGKKTFIAGAALEAKRRVKISSGTTSDPPEVVYAGAGEACIGVTEYAAAQGEPVQVRLKNSPGTCECEADVGTSIARGTVLYGAANGKLSDTVSGTAQAIALEAATVDDAVIEVLFT